MADCRAPCHRCGDPCIRDHYHDGLCECSLCWTPNCWQARVEGPACERCDDQGFYQDEADGTENYCDCQAGIALEAHEATPCPPQPTALMRRLTDPSY